MRQTGRDQRHNLGSQLRAAVEQHGRSNLCQLCRQQSSASDTSTLRKDFLDLHEEDTRRLLATSIKEVDETVPFLQPIEPDASPRSEAVLSKLIVVDLESVRTEVSSAC